jgi:6-phosphogluconolactonase
MKNRLRKLFLTIGCAISASAMAQTPPDYDLLVGSYTQGASKGIYRLSFDARTGIIDPTPQQVIASSNPAWLTLSKDGTKLYAVNENSPGQSDPIGRVSSYFIDKDTNVIRFANQIKSLGAEPTHSNLSTDGRYLFVANYDVKTPSGGSLVVLPTSDKGLSEVVQISHHVKASKVDPIRQNAPHVHSAVPTPDGKLLVASDLGADRIYVYRYNPHRPQPLAAATPPFIDLPPGSGPRHVVFSKDGKHAYLTLELSGQIAIFDYKNAELSNLRLTNAHDNDGRKNGVGGIHISTDDQFIYVANRGQVNKLYVYSRDRLTGALQLLQSRSVEGIEPREFAIAPSGEYMLIANQTSKEIVVMRRDSKTGVLLNTIQKLPFDSPSHLIFLTKS